MDVSFLDNLNNPIEEINLVKPKTYQELLIVLRQKIKKLPKFYEIFIIDKNNKEFKINNDETYNLIEDLLFIREIDNNILEQSLFQKNYDKLSESKQEILDEKYNCLLCSILIKNENPYLCYKCQKIYHENCLKKWDEKCKSQHKNLMCPNCRNELPLEKWNKKIDYEGNRIDNANLINEINEYKLNNNLNKNIQLIKDRKINELKYNNMTKTQLIEKYEKYINNTFEIILQILNRINSIRLLINNKENIKLEDFLKQFPLNLENLENLEINNISNIIEEELEYIEKYIRNKNQTKIKLIYSNIYYNKLEGEKIFGEKFVENNKNNIDLLIEGKKSQLISKYKFKNWNTVITMIIKNKLTDLSYMFDGCRSLKDIDVLKYLDTKDVKDFSYMFNNFRSTLKLNSLEKWNVSNGINFSYMFNNCVKLLDITPLENWNVSNGINFSYMFNNCEKLSNLKPLKNWNVSKVTDLFLYVQ